MTDFVSFDKDGKRWWVVSGPTGAVSLTAVVMPDGMQSLSTSIRDANGGQLMPDCFTVHKPGTEQCPALPGGCDGTGEAFGSARQVLTQWAVIAHEDRFLRSVLDGFYAEYVTEV